jgi:hypothetical protein
MKVYKGMKMLRFLATDGGDSKLVLLCPACKCSDVKLAALLAPPICEACARHPGGLEILVHTKNPPRAGECEFLFQCQGCQCCFCLGILQIGGLVEILITSDEGGWPKIPRISEQDKDFTCARCSGPL